MIRLENRTSPHFKFWEGSIEQTASGEWSLVRRWGRISIGFRGRTIRRNFPRRTGARLLLVEVVRDKVERGGYHITECGHETSIFDRVFLNRYWMSGVVNPNTEVNINSNDNVEEESLPEEGRENWIPSPTEVTREVESNPGTYGGMPNPASSLEARRRLIERHTARVSNSPRPNNSLTYEPTTGEIAHEVAEIEGGGGLVSFPSDMAATQRWTEARRILIENHSRSNYEPTSAQIRTEALVFTNYPTPAQLSLARERLIRRHRREWSPTSVEISNEIHSHHNLYFGYTFDGQRERARTALISRHSRNIERQNNQWQPTESQIAMYISMFAVGNPLSSLAQRDEAIVRLTRNHRTQVADERPTASEVEIGDREVRVERDRIARAVDEVRRTLASIPTDGGEPVIAMLQEDKDREAKILIQTRYYRKVTKRPTLQELLA